VVKGEKITILIDNQRKEFRNKNNTNTTDELEAHGSVTVMKFKEWMMKSYVDITHLKESITADLANSGLNEKEVIY
jgi:hypothetical protein